MNEKEATISACWGPPFIDFAVFPDVPLQRVLNYLPGSEVEKCRLISVPLYSQIEKNRQMLNRVEVLSLEIEQYPNCEYIDDEGEQMSSTLDVTIQRKKYEDQEESDDRCLYPQKLTLEETLELFHHALPRMTIKNLHLRTLTSFVFRELLTAFVGANVKCENLFAVQSRGFDIEDLRPMLLQLKPINLSLKVNGNENRLTSDFLRDECIQKRQQLHIEGYPYSGFDDGVLESLSASTALIDGISNCTFEGIAAFLKDWKEGGRDIAVVKFRTLSTGLDVNRLIAMLPWNIPAIQPDPNGVFPIDFAIELQSLEGNSLNLSIQQNTLNDSFTFNLVDLARQNAHLDWLPDYERAREGRYTGEFSDAYSDQDDSVDYDAYDYDYDHDQEFESDFYDEDDLYPEYQHHDDSEPEIRVFEDQVEVGQLPSLQLPSIFQHADDAEPALRFFDNAFYQMPSDQLSMSLVLGALTEWERIRSEELNQQPQTAYFARRFNVPFAIRDQTDELFNDVGTLSLAEQEKRLTTAICMIMHGWSSSDILFHCAGETYRMEVNISFNQKLIAHFETCRKALFYLFAIYRNTCEVMAAADGPSFSKILAHEIHLFLRKNVKPLALSQRSLTDLIHDLVKLVEVLNVCQELSKLLKKDNVTAKTIMDAVGKELAKAVSREVIDLLEKILYKTRELWSMYALAWITHGDCLSDPHLEFMIWPFSKLRQSNVALIHNANAKGAESYSIIDGRFVGIMDLCPSDYEADFKLIISTGKYIRLITAAGLRKESTQCPMILDEKTLHSSTLTIRAIRKVCRDRSEQLLKYIHEKFNLVTAYDTINSLFLGTTFDLSSMLIKVCGDTLYCPTDEVSLRQLQNKMNRIFERNGGIRGEIKDMKLAFADISFFVLMGAQKSGKDIPLVVTSLQLTWQPSTLLREIWTPEVVHKLTLIQRYLFVLTAILQRVEDRILTVAHNARLASRLRNSGSVHQHNLTVMHQLLLTVISWTRGVITMEAAICEEQLAKASSVEDMCELLINQLIAPIFQQTHLCNTKSIVQIHQACLAIHNYLEEDQDLAILEQSFEAFMEVRIDLLNHIDTVKCERYAH
ncbi:unnamed protein product, partial [Mesorhabditis belari]|uniref:Uncharacterized protein n=1 Tax=Mesorhabditis belari TaxID=2138241 RepID=A0AAF3JA58_9BILA